MNKPDDHDATIGLGNHGDLRRAARRTARRYVSGAPRTVARRERANLLARLAHARRRNGQQPGAVDHGPFDWDRTADKRLDNDMCLYCNNILPPWEDSGYCDESCRQRDVVGRGRAAFGKRPPDRAPQCFSRFSDRRWRVASAPL